MTNADKMKLEEVARALIAYSRAADEKPELKRLLDGVPVPGGEEIITFAQMARALSKKYPATIAA